MVLNRVHENLPSDSCFLCSLYRFLLSAADYVYYGCGGFATQINHFAQ